MSTVSGLSDNLLDGAFAASFDNKDFAAADFYGAEIRERLTSVWSFASGIFGAQRFPKYEARTGFAQADAAQKSLQVSAADAANNAAGALKIGGISLAVLALVGVAVFAATR